MDYLHHMMQDQINSAVLDQLKMIGNTVKTFEAHLDETDRHQCHTKDEEGNSILNDIGGHSSDPHAHSEIGHAKALTNHFL